MDYENTKEQAICCSITYLWVLAGTYRQRCNSITLTRGVTCLFCGLDYPCPHMPGLEEQVAMANGYRNALVQQIKDAGQELINRAESMVHPENDLITDFSIVIHFEQHEVPTIDYTTSVINKVACDRVIYQKGESNVSKI